VYQMPAKSAKQYRFMAMIAHGGTPKKGLGPSEAVAKEFVMKTSAKKRKEWSK
jgi:hypothetical protein